MKRMSTVRAVFACSLLVAPAVSASPAPPVLPALAAQVTFEQAVRDLTSADSGTRLRAVQMLKEAAYPEAAVPLAPLVTDAVDEVQLQAIAAELNIFLAEKIVPRKRLGLVIEVRNPIAAAAAFSAGPLALGSLPVPAEVLTALRAGARDENPRVALEALYAFGALAIEPIGNARRELLRASGPDLASMLGAQDPALRFTAVRVLGRLFEHRADDPPVDQLVGDAVITALNDADRTVRAASMQTLGAMRYERAVQGLTDLFQHFGKGELAEASLDAIAHIGHPYSSPLLSSQLINRSAAIRGIAMEGLGLYGRSLQGGPDRCGAEKRAQRGREAGGQLRRSPADGGGHHADRRRVDERETARSGAGYLLELARGRTTMFTRYAQDPDEQVRIDIADILGLAGDPAALAMLDPLARDANPQVASAAARAIARLRRAQSKPVSDAG